MTLPIDAHLDHAIDEKRHLLEEYRSREGRIAEAHTRRVESACAEEIRRAQVNAQRDEELMRRMKLETAVLEFAFEQLKARALMGDPVVSLPTPRRALPAYEAPSAPPIRPVFTVPAIAVRSQEPGAQALLSEMKTAMDAIRVDLTKKAADTAAVMQKHVGEVAALTDAVNRAKDEFPAVFRYQGPMHD